MWIYVKETDILWKSLWIISQNNSFSLYVTFPPRDQCQVPIIRFVPKTLHQTLVNFTLSSPGYWQTGCLWWEAVESWFHLDLKSFFALKNNLMGFVLGHITRWINVIYEWNGHDTTPSSLFMRYVSTTDSKWYSFNYYLRWSSQHDRLGCHAPMVQCWSQWDQRAGSNVALIRFDKWKMGSSIGWSYVDQLTPFNKSTARD